MPTDNIISRTDADVLIPQNTVNEIIQNLPEQSAALQLCKQYTLSTSQTRVPVISALAHAYFVNGDTGLKQTTSINWNNVYLNAEELACIVPIPEAVLDDASYDVWGEVRPRLEEAIALKLDGAVFLGVEKPASWSPAIAPAAIAASNTVVRGTAAAGSGKIAGDLSDLFNEVESDGFDVNGIVARPIYKGLLRNARNANGTKLAEISPQDIYGMAPKYSNLGWDTDVSSPEAIVGDFTKAIIGVRQDITYKVLDQAIIQDSMGNIVFNLAQQDMVALRVVARFAFATANPATAANSDEETRYPFAAMISPGS